MDVDMDMAMDMDMDMDIGMVMNTRNVEKYVPTTMTLF
jgi:hypothetical protein